MRKILVCSVLIIAGLTAFAENLYPTKADDTLVQLDNTQLHCLAQNIYFEAGNQSLEGMAAVADVTLNRVQEDRYPDTVCEVVKQGLQHPNGAMKRNMCQFSWYCDGKSDRVPNIANNKTWQNAEFVAKAMLLEYNMTEEGNYFGITCGSTHYHANYVVPDWIEDRGMNRTKQIGKHIFYKLW